MALTLRMLSGLAAAATLLSACGGQVVAEAAASADEATAPGLSLSPVAEKSDAEFALEICDEPPSGEWRITSYEIDGDVTPVSQEEIDDYLGLTFSVSPDRLAIGDVTCTPAEDPYWVAFANDPLWAAVGAAPARDVSGFAYRCDKDPPRTLMFTREMNCENPALKYENAWFRVAPADS